MYPPSWAAILIGVAVGCRAPRLAFWQWERSFSDPCESCGWLFLRWRLRQMTDPRVPGSVRRACSRCALTDGRGRWWVRIVR